MRLRARDTPPDHVVVELSGAADTANVTPWGRSAGFILDGVVIVVAADQLAPVPGLGDLPERARTAIEAQIVDADLLILTKTSLVADERAAEAKRRLRTLAPNTPIFVAPAADSIEAGAIGAFLNLGGRRSGGVADIAEATLFDAHEVRRFDVAAVGSLDELHAAIDDILSDVEDQPSLGTVVRAKGVVATVDERLWLVQIVGTRREVTPMLLSEWQAPTGLVVITLP